MAILGKGRAREWETVWATLERAAGLFDADPDGLGMSTLVANVRALVKQTFELIDQDAPFVMYNLGFDPELVYALPGVGPTCVAMLTALSSIIGDQADTQAFIDAAEAAGYSAECCSADKGGIGALLKGLYPEPCCLVGINTPCDSQVSVSNAMFEHHRDRPAFVIDVPPYEDERTFRHVAAQLRLLIPFLEKHTGRKMEWDRLKAVCETSNRTSEHLLQWMEWRSQVPTMQPSKLSAFTMAMSIMFFGSPLGEALARDFARDAKNKVESGVRYFDEKVRAIWYQDPVWWDIQIYDWMEAELGLTIPIDIFGYYAGEGIVDTSSEETILYGLARKMVNCHPMSRQFRGAMKRYIDDFMTLHRRFNADCGIMAGHIACKHSWGGIGLFKEACRKADIPLLVFEFDMFDPRVLSRKELQFELKRFVEDVVLPRKERKG
jgi:benzoyl-CoA reductase subunit B